MVENDDRINQLLKKLDILLQRQESFSSEVNQLRAEIYNLKFQEIAEPSIIEEAEEFTPIMPPPIEIITEEELPESENIEQEEPIIVPPRYTPPIVNKQPNIQENLEKFIGENLINKIGIAITVIGVAIGAKYAIEHQLISPLTRIIFGYIIGLGLLGFAIKLKKNYENFSAVLLSGSLAIMYFITFAAYSFYELFPQLVTFGLMVVFTIFAVTAAINYNKQIIAHIGLVGAYAVPFLLSDGSGRVVILFSYMAIINIGILVIAFKKYWKPLYYSSFVLTWIIFLSWFGYQYDIDLHFKLALIFLAIFFVTFYMMFLAYKLLQKEKFELSDIALMLTNSFIFYGIGYYILDGHIIGEHYLGLFTLGNAFIHSIFSIIFYRQKLADRNLFYLVSGLVLVFITISIPVQLDGNWVTLLWTGEAALLFWIGRTKNVQFYEILSYGLMMLAITSLVQDWITVYNVYDPEHPETRLIPLFNINFLTSLLFIASFGYINILNRNSKYTSPLKDLEEIMQAVSFLLPSVLIVIVYYTFRLEISTYFDQLYHDSFREIKMAGQTELSSYFNSDLSNFKTLWIINYSFLYFIILSFLNIKIIKSKMLGEMNLVINTIVLFVFLILGLYQLSELRESYLYQTATEIYSKSVFNIGMRYVSFAFVGLMLVAIYNYIIQDFLKPIAFNMRVFFDLLLCITLIWIVSSELINWMDVMRHAESYKLGLSILWGLSALLLISLGIWKKKKHLRIIAIVLFGTTLLKLFFYDIRDLDTISKTIVFVTLGILLLIISFLYNKYKLIISDDNNE